jgi:hypothetical protein
VRRPVASVTLACCALSGCLVRPAAEVQRPALPLPASVAATFAVPAWQQVRWDAPVPAGAEVVRRDGALLLEDRELGFSVFLPTGNQGPRPFLLALPILAAGRALLVRICTDLAERGFVTGFAERQGGLFRREEQPVELEAGIRRTVVENRAFLAWVAAQPEVDPACMGLVGVSLGAIVGTVLAAVEPRIQAACLLMAGADLPALLVDTGESRVTGWARLECERSRLTSEGLERLLRTVLCSDPAAVAGYIETERVFLFTAQLDAVVPRRNGELLWEALGRPARMLAPVGHYTAALVYGKVLDEVERFSRRRFTLRTGEPFAVTSPLR